MPNEQLQRSKRGLSALLASTAKNEIQQVNSNSVVSAEVIINSIRQSPLQPRTNFDSTALAELAASISARGLIQPIVVRKLRPDESSENKHYELIAGERRWRAAQVAGLETIPVIIKDVFDSRDILLLSLVENIQRDDLNPIEEALAYAKLSKDFSLTHEQIAEGVGKNRSSISNIIRLLELPTSIQDAIKSRRLSLGHAKVLLSIPDHKIICQLAAKVQAEGLTVRELERLVVEASSATKNGIRQTTPGGNGGAGRIVPPNIQDIEHRLREYFGTRVNVEEGLRKGRIVIEFYSVEDFERITGLFGLAP
jgi:ParB family chromosome partitioning protein